MASRFRQFARIIHHLMIACILAMGARVVLSQTCEWRVLTGSGPERRLDHAMAYDGARGVTVLFGGRVNSEPQNDTWEWDGSVWRKVAEGGPSPRSKHAMAYDSRRGVTVLFGGWEDENVETWEWDGLNWKKVASSPSLRNRYGHAMAYDSSRGVTVLFGGYGDHFELSTWEWDGVTWEEVATDGPPGGFSHEMAYDSIRQVCVLIRGGTSRLSNTWEWDGVEWVLVAENTGPSPRSDHALVFDSTRGLVLLFGGRYVSDRLGDTWQWDGVEWRHVSDVGPEARYDHAMAYDQAREQTVLFGGCCYPAETWVFARDIWFVRSAVDVIASSGEPAEFSIAVDGYAKWQYQWYLDGLPLTDGGPISGSTTATLQIGAVSREHDGSYECVVTSDSCEITSRAARLFVLDPLLEVEPSCPPGGPITVRWKHVYPSGHVALVWSREEGAVPIPIGQPCAGTPLGLGQRGIRLLWDGSGGPDGGADLLGSAPPMLCGGFMQIVDLETCMTSNVVRVN